MKNEIRPIVRLGWPESTPPLGQRWDALPPEFVRINGRILSVGEIIPLYGGRCFDHHPPIAAAIAVTADGGGEVVKVTSCHHCRQGRDTDHLASYKVGDRVSPTAMIDVIKNYAVEDISLLHRMEGVLSREEIEILAGDRGVLSIPLALYGEHEEELFRHCASMAENYREEFLEFLSKMAELLALPVNSANDFRYLLLRVVMRDYAQEILNED